MWKWTNDLSAAHALTYTQYLTAIINALPVFKKKCICCYFSVRRLGLCPTQVSLADCLRANGVMAPIWQPSLCRLAQKDTHTHAALHTCKETQTHAVAAAGYDRAKLKNFCGTHPQSGACESTNTQHLCQKGTYFNNVAGIMWSNAIIKWSQ